MLDQAKSHALKYITFRSRSVQEVKEYLQGKGHNYLVIQEVIKYLEELGYLNDYNFCELWIRDRIKMRPMGKKRIYHELLIKGIDTQIIEKALKDFLSREIEEQLLFNLINKKSPQYNDKNKLIKFLYNRGFEPSIIFQVINENFVDYYSS